MEAGNGFARTPNLAAGPPSGPLAARLSKPLAQAHGPGSSMRGLALALPEKRGSRPDTGVPASPPVPRSRCGARARRGGRNEPGGSSPRWTLFLQIQDRTGDLVRLPLPVPRPESAARGEVPPDGEPESCARFDRHVTPPRPARARRKAPAPDPRPSERRLPPKGGPLPGCRPSPAGHPDYTTDTMICIGVGGRPSPAVPPDLPPASRCPRLAAGSRRGRHVGSGARGDRRRKRVGARVRRPAADLAARPAAAGALTWPPRPRGLDRRVAARFERGGGRFRPLRRLRPDRRRRRRRAVARLDHPGTLLLLLRGAARGFHRARVAPLPGLPEPRRRTLARLRPRIRGHGPADLPRSCRTIRSRSIRSRRRSSTASTTSSSSSSCSRACCTAIRRGSCSGRDSRSPSAGAGRSPSRSGRPGWSPSSASPAWRT